MSPSARRIAVLLASAVLLSAPSLFAQRERLPIEDLEVVESRWPNAKKTSTGLRYIVLKEGDQKGPTPNDGDRAAVLYKGMLLDGTVFDQSQDPAKPFMPRVGRDELIPAWDQALRRMRKGDKWLLIVPFELGYGTRGNPPKIPKRATLIFEMELLDFAKELPLR